jgi:hypothetical protein
METRDVPQRDRECRHGSKDSLLAEILHELRERDLRFIAEQGATR